MAQAIGFANKFYTLWSIDTNPVYTTDSYGQHHLTGHDTRYTYHKNISFDLDKAKALYPDLEVREDLRGITTSWTSENKEDLCPQIMKFGKHYGKDINELLEQDFQYLVWLYENSRHSSNGKYVMGLPKIQEYLKAISDAENKRITDRANAFEAILKAGVYEFIPERNLRLSGGCGYISENIGDLRITFKFERGTYSENEYNGYYFGLPIVNGKAKRMKGKTIKFEFVEDKTEVYQVIVTNVTIFKEVKAPAKNN